MPFSGVSSGKVKFTSPDTRADSHCEQLVPATRALRRAKAGVTVRPPGTNVQPQESLPFRLWWTAYVIRAPYLQR